MTFSSIYIGRPKEKSFSCFDLFWNSFVSQSQKSPKFVFLWVLLLFPRLLQHQNKINSSQEDNERRPKKYKTRVQSSFYAFHDEKFLLIFQFETQSDFNAAQFIGCSLYTFIAIITFFNLLTRPCLIISRSTIIQPGIKILMWIYHCFLIWIATQHSTAFLFMFR